MEEEKIIFCKSGGCTAKLGAGVLEHILEKLPKGEKDPNLLVGYDSKDDASVYRLTDDLAMVQTLDFFPPVVEDPYTFGKIAAANALSDIYAMGGEVRTALNIVCFPEQMDLNVLGEIMRGGAEKVQEAGGSLSGGHSIADDSVKYGLSVTGTVHPDRIWQNNTGRVGDLLILTKPLGTGILCAAHRVGEENPGGFQKAVESMGNPHAVIPVEDVEKISIAKTGSAFEHLSCFPDRINTEFIQILDQHTIKMRVWERGSGETLSCGTGACAAAVAAMVSGCVSEGETAVELRGGRLFVTWDRTKNKVLLTGPAETVFEGTLAE